MNVNELKATLKEFKEKNYQHPGIVNIQTLTNAMLEHVGNTDPELRDNLIYPSLTNLIINDIYPRPELNRILKVCLDDNHLFYKMGQDDEDAVFTRSFSSLIIAVLLFVNVQKSFITDEELDNVATKLVDYVKKEVDVRGFVEGKGWAHSIAHVADALDELAKQSQLKETRFQEIAHLILDKMCFEQDYYLFEEDERMVIPLVTMLHKGMDLSFLFDKINEISNDLQENYSKNSVRHFTQRTNIKQFLRSLLLHLEVTNQQKELQDHLREVLKSINQPYYNL
ncbi:DUF2785 domain-containing protein [Ornithinibacillus californiensis]|uniref:DUF2785 domain-containing protein n=1 Tax=Ornithinibacillus californiensis TaxID=161536 RepID=UPI00064E0B09|nr:DUF2785 domain-containing protein [Ornithinibacillus californiensis]